MVEGCVTDLPLGKEEAACLRWLGHLDHDHHPDAVACRIKLSLAAAPCPDMSAVLPWDLVEQAHLYVTRRGHVSARCRLSPEEELLMLEKATKVANLAAVAAAKEREALSPRGSVSLGAQAGRCTICSRRVIPESRLSFPPFFVSKSA